MMSKWSPGALPGHEFLEIVSHVNRDVGDEYPLVFRTDVRGWLGDLSRRDRRPVLLDSVPSSDLDDLADAGFRWLWLRGVWVESPASREANRRHATLLDELKELLPDLTIGDICGSPWAVVGYRVADDLGGEDGLEALRADLASREMRILLDCYPGHVAPDHPWLMSRPELFVRGEPSEAAACPERYYRDPLGNVFARAVDSGGILDDAIQLNLRSAQARAIVLEELDGVLGKCDGVHMAHLSAMRIEEIRENWGDASLPVDGSPPVDSPFWPEVVRRVAAASPGVIVVQTAPLGDASAEESPPIWTMDDRFRDLLISGGGDEVRSYLTGRLGRRWMYLNALERDVGPRIAESMPSERAAAASILAALAPGGTMFEDGQLEGRRRRWDPRLRRRPEEPVDRESVALYEAILEVLGRPEVVRGSVSIPTIREAWSDNPSWEQFVVLLLRARDSSGVLLAAVNFGPLPGQCYVDLSELDPAGHAWTFQDLLSLAIYVREGDDVAGRGLYLDLPPWDYHVFEVRRDD